MKYNNEVIERAIMEALTKKDNGLEINREELLRAIMNDSDKDFGIDTVNRKYTKKELQYSIYIHINKKDGYKIYVGQTGRRPEDRWKTGYKKQYLGYSIKSHKWDWEKDFSHIVLCYGLTQEEADALEIALIAIFKSQDKQYGYNVANGGNSVGQHSEETRNKMSEARKGKQHSEETRNKMSEARKGKQHSEETRNKMSEAHKGKQHSEESKKKMSEASKGKQHSEETRKKMSDNNKGENNPKAKKVYCNGKIFSTIKQCAKFYNMNYSTMNAWLQGRNKMPSEFIELGLRYTTEEDIEKYPLYIEEEQHQQNKQD